MSGLDEIAERLNASPALEVCMCGRARGSMVHADGAENGHTFEADPEWVKAEQMSDAALAVDDETGKPITFKLTKRADAPPIGFDYGALAAFRAAARRLKQTESDYRDAQQAYGEAVKRLSDEAVK